MNEINAQYFEHFPELNTKRLHLRAINLNDANRIFEMRSNQRIGQFIPRPQMKEVEAAAQLVEKTQKAYKERNGMAWAGVLKESQELIGTCGFNSIEWENRRAEIGGEMLITHWGRKYSHEAVAAIVEFGIKKLGLHAIEAKVSPENRGAVYLLESIGFKKEAHFKDRVFYQGAFSDMAVYTFFENYG